MNSKSNPSNYSLNKTSVPSPPTPPSATDSLTSNLSVNPGPTDSLSVSSPQQLEISKRDELPVGSDGMSLPTSSSAGPNSLAGLTVAANHLTELPIVSSKSLYFESTQPAPKSAIPPLMLVLPPEIEAAEGYLELISGPATQFGVRPKFRRMFARKALELLSHVGECWHNPRHEARRQLAIGNAYRLLKQYDLAAQAFRKAASYRSFRAGAMAAAGMCEKKMGRLGEAITSLTRALSVNPDIARYHFQLARCLCLAGQSSAALFELGFAIHLDAEMTHRAFQCADFDALRGSSAFRSLIERGVHFV